MNKNAAIAGLVAGGALLVILAASGSSKNDSPRRAIPPGPGRRPSDVITGVKIHVGDGRVVGGSVRAPGGRELHMTVFDRNFTVQMMRLGEVPGAPGAEASGINQQARRAIEGMGPSDHLASIVAVSEDGSMSGTGLIISIPGVRSEAGVQVALKSTAFVYDHGSNAPGLPSQDTLIAMISDLLTASSDFPVRSAPMSDFFDG